MPTDPKPSGLTSREASRFVTYYRANIKEFTPVDCRGVIRQIQLLVQKGITVDLIATALENYHEDMKDTDPRFIKHIRSFFKAEIIRQWQTRLPKRGLPDISFTPIVVPVPAKPMPPPVEESNDL